MGSTSMEAEYRADMESMRGGDEDGPDPRDDE